MYLYYPVILIFVSFVILFCPAPILFHKSRRWFLYSHVRLRVPLPLDACMFMVTDISQWRLFFAGLYPVEFRDFFLGDMYCSLTYAMCVSDTTFSVYLRYRLSTPPPHFPPNGESGM